MRYIQPNAYQVQVLCWDGKWQVLFDQQTFGEAQRFVATHNEPWRYHFRIMRRVDTATGVVHEEVKQGEVA